MDVLQRLSTGELAALAAALRSGRLVPPYGEALIRRYVTSDLAVPTVVWLAGLDHDGMQPKHAARLLDAVHRTRESVSASPVELVWTGPECEGLSNRDTGVVMRELFGSATSEVLVAGFAVYRGIEVFRRLAERMTEVPRLRVRLFLDIRRSRGDSTASSELVWKFVTHFRSVEWPGASLPELYFDPRSLDARAEKRSSLHAKCVVIDRRVALVTSANFTEAAQTRNIEVGVLIRSPAFATELSAHFDSMQAGGLLTEMPKPH